MYEPAGTSPKANRPLASDWLMPGDPMLRKRRESVPRPSPPISITIAPATGAPDPSTTTPETRNAGTATSRIVRSLTVSPSWTVTGCAAETSAVPGKNVEVTIVVADDDVEASPKFDGRFVPTTYSPGESPKIRNSPRSLVRL